MADNIIGRDGAGNQYIAGAREDADGVLHQRTQPTVEGLDVSPLAPMPTTETAARELLYARDAADRMRVVVDNSGATMGYVNLRWAVDNVWQPYYSSGAPTSMDAREQQRELTVQTFAQQRARWVFS